MKPRVKIEKTWVVLGVALAIGVLAAVVANQYITGHIKELDARDKNRAMTTVIVVVNSMKRGSKPVDGNLALRQIPTEYAPASAIPPAEYKKIYGREFAHDLNQGEAIVWSALKGPPAATFSTHVAKGRRAMSVPVDEISSISGMLEPGDLIDLMVTIGQKDKKITFPLLQSVNVLAAGQRVVSEASDGQKRSYNTITLDTTPDEARRVIIARDSGKITALLRHPEDTVPMSNAKGDLSALLGIQDGGVSSGIPVLYGGGKLGDIPRLGDDSAAAGIAGSLAASARDKSARDKDVQTAADAGKQAPAAKAAAPDTGAKAVQPAVAPSGVVVGEAASKPPDKPR